MFDQEYEKFYLVSNAESSHGIPVHMLNHPPKGIHTDEKEAESEALRLAQKTGERFFVLEAKAYVEIKDAKPVWVEV